MSFTDDDLKRLKEVVSRSHPGQYDGPIEDRFMGCCPLCDEAEELRALIARLESAEASRDEWQNKAVEWLDQDRELQDENDSLKAQLKAADELAELLGHFKGPCGCDLPERCDLHKALGAYLVIRAGRRDE